MITRYANIITDILISRSGIDFDEDQREIYIYGLECIMNTGITILILAIWGGLTGSITETLVWIIAFSTLRHHTGGYHASTHSTCILSSTLLGISNLFVIRYKHFLNQSLEYIYLFCFLVCILCVPQKNTKLTLTPIQKIYQKNNLPHYSSYWIFVDKCVTTHN